MEDNRKEHKVKEHKEKDYKEIEHKDKEHKEKDRAIKEHKEKDHKRKEHKEDLTDKDNAKNLVPEDKILKIMEIIGIKQPKESCHLVQKVVEKYMDDFIDRLKEIKKLDKKQKINEEDIKDLVVRDDIEYLKEILKD